MLRSSVNCGVYYPSSIRNWRIANKFFDTIVNGTISGHAIDPYNAAIVANTF